MKRFFILLFIAINLNAYNLTLSNKDALVIANKIWQNEGSGKKSYLVWWNKGEEFASCGIGHFIWFTKDKPMWFFHAFPDMLRFIIKEGAKPPAWLKPDMSCVWNSYDEWKKAKKNNTKKMQELTNFLNNTKALQAKYMVHRLNGAYKKLLDYAKTKEQKQKIKHNFNALLYKNGKVDMQGAYCLIDYTNFKGDGTLESERYQNTGWGLFQVLEHMDSANPNKYKAFANSVRYILDRLIKVSPPKRRLFRFRKGWFNRAKTYER
jgi:mRNA-degrading endonuclease YafQ of YafQ-DinJ toxin-antitoxin module